MVIKSKTYVVRCYFGDVISQRWYKIISADPYLLFHRSNNLPAFIKDISYYSSNLGITEYWEDGGLIKFGREG